MVHTYFDARDLDDCEDLTPTGSIKRGDHIILPSRTAEGTRGYRILQDYDPGHLSGLYPVSLAEVRRKVDRLNIHRNKQTSR